MVAEMIRNIECMPYLLRMIAILFLFFPVLVFFGSVNDKGFLSFLLSLPVFLSGLLFLLRNRRAKYFMILGWVSIIFLAILSLPEKGGVENLFGVLIMSVALSFYVYFSPPVKAYLNYKGE